MRLNDHFTTEEFACKHCGQLGIKESFVNTLEEFRKVLGKPLLVQSGYRCPKHPIEAKKRTPGQHAMGIAADIRCPGMTPWELYRHIQAFGKFTGVGVHPQSYCHVDTREKPARWTYVNGKTAP